VSAQGPNDHPKLEGTIKGAVSADLAALFQQQLTRIEQRRAAWLERARQATPPLFRKPLSPVAIVAVEKDAAAFQGWKTVVTGKPESVCNRPLLPGDSFILDFGEHFSGYFQFSLRRFDIPVDAPVRLSLIFGEVPAEVAEPFDPYPGSLTRSWLQDEVVNIDDVPQTVRLPRRYAFRYVKVTVVAASKHGKFGFAELGAEAITSADEARLLPYEPANAEDAALDQVSRRTLRDCMQTVFEDGPKRDRRLWLGDLRLQALANYASYRNYDLVKRSLYILAGTATDKGLVGTCSFERPEPVRGGNSILDYTALFAPTVLEYLEASGDRQTADDLWPLVLKQLDFTLEPVNHEGLFVPPKGWWLFVDWHRTLDKQASEHAIVLVGAKATRMLAERLGKDADAAFLSEIIPRMEAAAREQLWDDAQGLFISGPKREVSWASQAWMVLAGVSSPEQARRALAGVLQHANAEKPVTPYMHHYVVEALLAAGLRDEARAHLHAYWGGMLQRGADTFWEVYVPGDELLSPYGSHLMNSYCHAWGCTPTYFLRNQPYLSPEGRTMLWESISLLVLMTIPQSSSATAAHPPSVDSRFVLWDPAQPVPAAADCPRLEGVQFVVIQPREPERDGYNWLHGAAVCWHDDELFVTFGHNLGSENTATEVAHGRKSADGGKTWGPLFAIDDGNTANPAVSHGVLLAHAGRLWAFHGCFDDHMQRVHTRAYRRDESSDRWQAIGVVAERGFWPLQEPLKMADGNWIMAGISVAGGYGGPDDPAAVAISHGEDFTRWDVVPIPKPPALEMWGESTVIVDGANVLNIARWGKPVALAAVSDDYGRTWTESRASNLPMAASKPYAGVLSTGQRYLIGTTTADAGNRRSPLTIAVSRPGEKYFSKIYRIRDAVSEGPGESAPGCRLSYPYAVEHADKLYVAYSNDGARGGNRNSAELAVIPVRSLAVGD